MATIELDQTSINRIAEDLITKLTPNNELQPYAETTFGRDSISVTVNFQQSVEGKKSFILTSLVSDANTSSRSRIWSGHAVVSGVPEISSGLYRACVQSFGETEIPLTPYPRGSDDIYDLAHREVDIRYRSCLLNAL